MGLLAVLPDGLPSNLARWQRKPKEPFYEFPLQAVDARPVNLFTCTAWVRLGGFRTTQFHQG